MLDNNQRHGTRDDGPALLCWHARRQIFRTVYYEDLLFDVAGVTLVHVGWLVG